MARTSAAVGRQTLSGSVQRGFTLHTELSRTILGSLPSACTTLSFPMAMPLGHLARASCSPPGTSMTHPWAISSSIRRWRRSGWASAFFQLVSNSLRQVSSGCWACWASTAGHWLLLTMGSKTPAGTPWARTEGKCLSMSWVMWAKCDRRPRRKGWPSSMAEADCGGRFRLAAAICSSEPCSSSERGCSGLLWAICAAMRLYRSSCTHQACICSMRGARQVWGVAVIEESAVL